MHLPHFAYVFRMIFRVMEVGTKGKSWAELLGICTTEPPVCHH